MLHHLMEPIHESRKSYKYSIQGHKYTNKWLPLHLNYFSSLGYKFVTVTITYFVTSNLNDYHNVQILNIMNDITYFIPSHNMEEGHVKNTSKHDWLCPELYEEIEKNLPTINDFDKTTYECDRTTLEKVCEKCFFNCLGFFNFYQAVQFVRNLCAPWGMEIRRE